MLVLLSSSTHVVLLFQLFAWPDSVRLKMSSWNFVYHWSFLLKKTRWEWCKRTVSMMIFRCLWTFVPFAAEFRVSVRSGILKLSTVVSPKAPLAASDMSQELGELKHLHFCSFLFILLKPDLFFRNVFFYFWSNWETSVELVWSFESDYDFPQSNKCYRH